MEPTASRPHKIDRKNKHPKFFKEWHEYATPIVQKFGCKILMNYSENYKEFWEKYQRAYKVNGRLPSLDFQDKVVRKQIMMRLNVMVCRLKKSKQKTVDTHQNYVKIQTIVKKKQKTKGLKNEADRIEILEREVKRQKITEISFASEITVETVKRIETETKFLNEFSRELIEQIRDYDKINLHNVCYGNSALNEQALSSKQEKQVSELQNKDATSLAIGERKESQGSSQYDDLGKLIISDEEEKGVLNSIRELPLARSEVGGVSPPKPSRQKKFAFQHLAISHQLRQKLQEIADDLSSKILECNPRELSDMNRRLDTIAKLIDTTRKLDLQPIYALNAIAEGGFNRQKELQGAVVNDKAMVDNGQIILEKPKLEQEITNEDIQEDLKNIGRSLLLGAANNFAEETITIDQEEDEEENNIHEGNFSDSK